jgi:disease resistance protein RPS2
VVLLEDIWKSLELQSLGVSLNDTGSKIVLITRIKEVCTSMEADEITRVELLSEEEGWQLFCSRAFRNGNVPQEIENVARKIVGECKGLSLAINVVAAAMRNDALSQMQNIDEAFYFMHDEIEEKLFQRVKWSYNSLQDYLKTCFVYFAAYPEDRVINCEEVIDIWIGGGLLNSSGESYLRDIGHNFIKFLRDRCLIEKVKTDRVGRIDSVKIHDVLSDLAIRIAEKEHMCYFKAGRARGFFPSRKSTARAVQNCH